MAKKTKGFSELLKQQRRGKTRQETMQEFADSIKQKPLGEGAIEIVKDPEGQVKMSDVLDEFVEPYEDDRMTLNQRQNLLGIAVIAWNLALLPEAERKNMLKKIIKEVLQGEDPLFQQETREIINEMVARKEQLFADNQRYIVSFQLQDLGTELNLTVASTLPGETTGKGSLI
ncbi:MAG: hypothetical protein WBB01_13895 [Phormidesmis sp.]